MLFAFCIRYAIEKILRICILHPASVNSVQETLVPSQKKRKGGGGNPKKPKERKIAVSETKDWDNKESINYGNIATFNLNKIITTASLKKENQSKEKITQQIKTFNDMRVEPQYTPVDLNFCAETLAQNFDRKELTNSAKQAGRTFPSAAKKEEIIYYLLTCPILLLDDPKGPQIVSMRKNTASIQPPQTVATTRVGTTTSMIYQKRKKENC